MKPQHVMRLKFIRPLPIDVLDADSLKLCSFTTWDTTFGMTFTLVRLLVQSRDLFSKEIFKKLKEFSVTVFVSERVRGYSWHVIA